MNPGACSCSSPTLAARDRVAQQRPALVADRPLGPSASLVGFRSRSIVARRPAAAAPGQPESASSCRVHQRLRALAVSAPWSRPDTCPLASLRSATHRSKPSACHSRGSGRSASVPPLSPDLTPPRRGQRPPGVGPGPPVRATNSSRTNPLAVFDDFA